MNVSMMDSYNLAWKLMHSLNGLTPQTANSGDEVLNTFQTERLTVAQQLIAFDKDFSSMFSGKIGTGEGESGLTHEQFLEVFSTGNGFTSGCGIEYPENLLVQTSTSDGLVKGTDYLSGILRPGRRLLNVKAKRHADGYRRDLQDGMSLFQSHISIC
jgi:phenol 2-monooxygenase